MTENKEDELSENTSTNASNQTDNFQKTLDELAHTSVELPLLSATVGTPLQTGVPKADKELIIGALKAVQDPELLLDIYELGLIYDIIQEENGDVKIIMTLTSPTCPIAGEMPSMVAHAVSSVQGVGQVTVELTFEPPWTIDRLSDEIKLMMGF